MIYFYCIPIHLCEREKTMKNITKRILSLALALILALPLSVPAFAYTDLTLSDTGFALLTTYEEFSAQKYKQDGKWYIGYATPCGASEYPNGISRSEAETLLRESVRDEEAALNHFLSANKLNPTQGQFDALVCFSFSFGTDWLNGTSDLVKIVRRTNSATRLQTAQAFGTWCHVGGDAVEKFALRRLKEAALYLDGNTGAAENEFAYLIVKREAGATYATDFRVYERGKSYCEFPAMYKLGVTLVGMKTSDGKTLTVDSTVSGSVTATPAWNKNTYTKSYTDIGANGWYRDYVLELSEMGVINGNSDGSYAPDRPVRTGEAFKLVLLAAGHPAQNVTGKHWASGYADYVLSKGWLEQSKLSDLDGEISRLDVASLAAKAMGYKMSSGKTPFADADNGYVTALYEAGIFTGVEENGSLLFKPDSSISRAETAAIVWRISKMNALKALQSRPKVSYSGYELDVLDGVPLNLYDKSAFHRSGSVMTYSGKGVTTKLGVDVSRFQGDIDWSQVAASGVDFAIVRVGGRGYTNGAMYDDPMFAKNADGAAAAGLQVGAYYFSQAISVEEAKEEADYVIAQLKGHKINGPVVFDWEVIGKSSARTYGIRTSTLCACARTFCEAVKKAGYSPMVYFNNYAGYIKYDLREIMDYDFWYAYYDTEKPPFYYDFQMWQYTSTGKVPGIKGNVDMDLWFIR